MAPVIWIIAGEESGDLYGARLAREIRALRPEAVVRGMGGHAMAGAGVDILVDSTELGVVGFAEVFRHLATFIRIFRELASRAESEKPDAVVLIDYPGFNLRFAARMRRAGIPVVYYVSPQVWAWKKGRIHTIARDVTRLLVIFPFEPAVYAGTGLDVEFIGHPLLEVLEACRDPDIERDPNQVLLLPGSRRAEIERVLPPLLETAAALNRRNPDLRFVIACPRPRIAEIVDETVARVRRRVALPDIPVLTGRTRERMQRATAGLAASGTVTMEAAILGLPLVSVYRVHPLTYALGRMLVRGLRFFTIVNLVADRVVFEEFLQGEVRPRSLVPALEAILPGGRRREDVLTGMADTVAALGGTTPASRRAAERVLAVAEERRREEPGAAS